MDAKEELFGTLNICLQYLLLSPYILSTMYQVRDLERLESGLPLTREPEEQEEVDQRIHAARVARIAELQEDLAALPAIQVPEEFFTFQVSIEELNESSRRDITAALLFGRREHLDDFTMNLLQHAQEQYPPSDHWEGQTGQATLGVHLLITQREYPPLPSGLYYVPQNTPDIPIPLSFHDASEIN